VSGGRPEVNWNVFQKGARAREREDLKYERRERGMEWGRVALFFEYSVE
jgi:hypothetical protein